MSAELFIIQGRKLQLNDSLTYRCATVARPHNPDAPAQPAEGGPYIGLVVGFTDDGHLGVRADGWWSAAPLYYVHIDDILSVTPYQPAAAKHDRQAIKIERKREST